MSNLVLWWILKQVRYRQHPQPRTQWRYFQSAQPAYYGYQPLFEDRRPRNVGDILTINLQENVSASKNSSANANRSGKTGFLAAILPGLCKVGWAAVIQSWM